MLFAQLWGVGGVRIPTFTVTHTPFTRTSRHAVAGSGAHFERSLRTQPQFTTNCAKMQAYTGLIRDRVAYSLHA